MGSSSKDGGNEEVDGEPVGNVAWHGVARHGAVPSGGGGGVGG